jgi:cytochrome c553
VPQAAAAARAFGSGELVALAGPAAAASAACTRCHSLDGTADPSGAFPRLDGQDRAYLAAAMRSYATGERPSGIMTSIVRLLSEQERLDAVAYYAGLAKKPLAGRASADAELLAAGRALVEAGAPDRAIPACATCHGGASHGRKPAVPDLAGQHADYVELQLRLWQEGVRGGDGAAAPMAEIARRLTAEQRRAVAAFWASLPEAP